MNTPAHLIIATAIFAKPNNLKVTWAAIIGGLLPDLSLYTLAAWSTLVQGNSAQHVFDTQYFSANWQQIFAVDNSFFVWALIIATGVFFRKHWLWVFGGAGFLHLCFDFLLHHDDARQHFWPLTDWVFNSPISYWDHNYYGQIISVMEVGLCAVSLAFLWRRFDSKVARLLVIGIATMELLPSIMFFVMQLKHPSMVAL